MKRISRPSRVSGEVFKASALAMLMLMVGFVVASSAPQGDSWVGAEKVVRASSGRLDLTNAEGQHGVCTTFSINDTKSYWMTAYHCYAPTMVVDGQIAWMVYQNEGEDIMVLMAPGAIKPALHPAKEPVAGMGAGAFGFGEGWEIGQFRVGKVAAVNQPLSSIIEEPTPSKVMLFDQGFQMGMSGGCLVDRDGRVIGIIQMGDPAAAIGISRTIDTLMKLTNQFWTYKQ